MTKMTGKARYHYDALAVLFAENFTTVTDGSESKSTPRKFVVNSAYWNNPNEPKELLFGVFVRVKTLTAGKTLTLAIKIGDDDVNPATTTYKLDVTATGDYLIPVDVETLLAMNAAATHFVLSAVGSDSSTSYNLFAYLTPVNNYG